MPLNRARGNLQAVSLAVLLTVFFWSSSMDTFDFYKNDPFKNFEILFHEAQRKGIPEPNAMNIATVDSQGRPSVRVVLFKGFIQQGFSFFTNYRGKKAQDLEQNSLVCLNFFWPQMEKQVRVYGQAIKLSREENQTYFQTRPRASQIGAWTSDQSETISSFDFLQEKFEKFEKQFENQQVPCPEHWGGYSVRPTEVEFWFGRVGRMHERYIYTLVNNQWQRSLRSP